jgi:hypothetical protein
MTRMVLVVSLFASVAMAQPPAPAPSVRGYFAQIASGGTWKTTLTLYNPTLIRTSALVVFRRGGEPLLLPLRVTQGGVSTSVAATELGIALQPLSNIVLETEGGAQTVSGFAEIVSTRRLGGTAVMRQRQADGRVGEAVAPLEYTVTPSILIPFDTRAGQATGVALVNPTDSPMSIVIRARNENGAFLSEIPFFLPARGNTAFDLDSQFELVNVQGTVEIFSPIVRQILGLGIRFSGEGAFTSIPVLALAEPIPNQP